MTELVYGVTVAFTNLLPFDGDFSLGGAVVAESQIWAVEGLTDLLMRFFAKKKHAREV